MYLEYVLYAMVSRPPDPFKCYSVLRVFVFQFTAGWQSFNDSIIWYYSLRRLKQFISILIITFKGSFYPDVEYSQARQKQSRNYFCLARPGKFLMALPCLSGVKQVLICLNCSAANSNDGYLEVSASPRFHPSYCKNSNTFCQYLT